MKAKHRVQRLKEQFETNMRLLQEQYREKGLKYRINYESNPQETDPYRYAIEVKTSNLFRTINRLAS